MINFVSYDHSGKVLSAGFMAEICLKEAVKAGDPILPIPPVESIDIAATKVDLSKMQLVGITPPPAPEPESQTLRSSMLPISDKQFYTKAAIDGVISQEDALKAVQSGFIPAPMQAFIDTIQDSEVRFAATMLFGGETTIYRQHPLIEGFFLEQGKDVDAMDRFFTEAVYL